MEEYGQGCWRELGSDAVSSASDSPRPHLPGWTPISSKGRCDGCVHRAWLAQDVRQASVLCFCLLALECPLGPQDLESGSSVYR